jgi:type I restriction enzyme M protein
MYPLLEKDEKAEVVYDKGKPVVDMELRDTEIVPFTYEGGIDAFMKNEVLTYAPDAFVDEKKTTVGYEISFTKYFYKPVELREMSEILADLNALEQQADGMMASIMEGIL